MAEATRRRPNRRPHSIRRVAACLVQRLERHRHDHLAGVGISLEVSASLSLGCCVPYSPSADAGFFCFEPVNHPVDTHNLPDETEANGLVVLGKGAEMRATCRFSPAQ